jgi:hypothetical protein
VGFEFGFRLRLDRPACFAVAWRIRHAGGAIGPARGLFEFFLISFHLPMLIQESLYCVITSPRDARPL